MTTSPIPDKSDIKIYLDDSTEPFKTAQPPVRFPFSTINLPDGPHVLRIEASNGLAPPSVKEIPFRVRNGVALSVSGLEPEQTIGGQVELIVNAYAGNTEVDFEPGKAETPRPVPTWAWVVLLGITAWSLFYMFNPNRPPREAAAALRRPSWEMGKQVYVNTCARCHGEDGLGRKSSVGDKGVARLRETPTLAVAQTPFRLLKKVSMGVHGTQMPAWGQLLSNEEIVSVVNYVRTSWGHDASTIVLDKRHPPEGIEELEARLAQAMKHKDAEEMGQCCWPKTTRPALYRTDLPKGGVNGTRDVAKAWNSYFKALCDGRIEDFQLLETRYDYEPETVHHERARVVAMGRIYLSTVTDSGKLEHKRGSFIRVYGRNGKDWFLEFDFADIPMAIGCEPDAVADGVVHATPGSGTPTSGSTSTSQPPAAHGALSYENVQNLFRALEPNPQDAPHDAFWNLPYKEFVELVFPESWDDFDNKIKMIKVGDGANSNLIRALRDGRGIVVDLPGGKTKTINISRMPKGAKPMPAEDIDAISKWIDAGCPEHASAGSVAPKDSGPGGVPKDPGTTRGPAPGQPVGFADVIAAFKRLKGSPQDAGHEAFWERGYADFVSLKFPFSWDDPDLQIRMIEPWNAAGSNMIRALRDGKGIVVIKDDGKTITRDIPRMPKNSPPMPEADIQMIERWINAGCPEKPGGKPFAPKPGGSGTSKGRDVSDQPSESGGANPAPNESFPEPDKK